MLKIRLQRVGRKNIPVFRIVVTESKNGPKSGKSLEVIGSYDPVNNFKEIKAERVSYWIERGAQLSGTINNFLIDKGIIKGEKRNVISKRKVKPEEKTEEKQPSQKAESLVKEAPAEAPKAEAPSA